MKSLHAIKKKKRVVLGLCITIALFIGCFFFYQLRFAPNIIFKKDPITIEIDSSIDEKQWVMGLKNITWKDIKIKGSVNIKKLGSYRLKYLGKGHAFSLNCKVVDTKKPIVTAVDQNISIDTMPDPTIFIGDIRDATKTKVTFKKKYKFDKLGDKKIVIVVRDEGGNETEVHSIVHVLEKDITPPVLSVHNFEIVKGMDVDLLSDIRAVDDRDGPLHVEIATDFNKDIAGVYQIIYTAVDHTGNKTSVQSSIQVYETAEQAGRVIYLTIDDGPTSNTGKMLEILKRYDVKATFFVTGAFPAYQDYIREAYAQGHGIGLHTFSHRYEEVYANDAAYFIDLAKIAALVKQQTGVDSHIIRFPGGTSNTVSSKYSAGIMSRLSVEVTRRGYQYIDWNASSGDAGGLKTSEDLLNTIKTYNGLKPIYLLTHDHGGDNTTSLEALPGIIAFYKSQGYVFKTLDMSVPAYHHPINN